jgi:hypothetical protein
MASPMPPPIWEPFLGVVRILDDIGIPYMVVGSVAASYYGLTRATHDVDLVVALRSEDVPALVAALEPDYYVDVEGAYIAAREADTFNAIHNEGVYKVDFWVLKDDEFSRTQFERRVHVDTEGVTVCVESAEDTILSKLLWNKITPSERQLADISSVISVNPKSLDWDYLRKWAVRLGVFDILNDLTKEQS